MYQRPVARLRSILPAFSGLAFVIALIGCGSGGPNGLGADVNSDTLPSGDTLQGPGPLPDPDPLPPPEPTPDPPADPDPPDPDTPPPPTPLPPQPPPTHSGMAFGPFGLWQPNTSIDDRLAPFSGSHNFTNPDSILIQIYDARGRNHRLILNMTGGPSGAYTTNGKFDLAKWKSRMNRFDTAPIREAVAAAVADGTVIGNSVIDEPETRQWGDAIDKKMLDEMGAYVRTIFPTLPVGVDHGPPAHLWRTSEHYHVLDYVIYQYAWWVTRGDIAAWRDEVRALAKRDGLALGFSVNIVNGGVQDRQGWDCKGTGGLGSRPPNCQLTSEQLRDWVEALGTDACVMLLWRYDGPFLTKPANQAVLKELSAKLSQAPKRSCRRP